MNPKLLLVIGLGVGYVLGTRAGRERYDQMKATVSEVWESPRVRKARREVEAYAQQQAPIIRERAEAIVKAAPGAIAETAKDVAEFTAATAKDVAGFTATTAKDVAAKTSSTAKNVASRVSHVAEDVRDQAVKTIHDVRERGEIVVERAVAAVGIARDDALVDNLDDLSDDLSDMRAEKP
ncbi:MAG: protoporphyrinogen oxidase [Microbacteriaceae bacterium]